MTISQSLQIWAKIIMALTFGLVITYIDSRPNWDDAGISAGMVFGSACIMSLIDYRKPWLWALLIGGWIPLHGIVINNNWASLLALAIAFAGAYAGSLLGRQFK